MHDAGNRRMAVIADGVVQLITLILKLSYIGHELFCQRVIRVGGINQIQHVWRDGDREAIRNQLQLLAFQFINKTMPDKLVARSERCWSRVRCKSDDLMRCIAIRLIHGADSPEIHGRCCNLIYYGRLKDLRLQAMCLFVTNTDCRLRPESLS